MYPYLPLSVSPYPKTELSVGQYVAITLVPVLTLIAWLLLVYIADRRPRHRVAATTVPPQQLAEAWRPGEAQPAQAQQPGEARPAARRPAAGQLPRPRPVPERESRQPEHKAP